MLLSLFACHRAEPPVAPPRTPVVEAPFRSAAGAPDAVVDSAGGADHLTVQAAIDAVADRSVIHVRPGHYDERIDFRGKTLWITSTAGAEQTILDADGGGSVVTVTSGEGPGTALVGFTLQDGDDQAVDVTASYLRLQDVVIEDTNGDRTIRSRSGNLELFGVVIDDSNESNEQVIKGDRGSLLLRGSTVACGDGDGILTDHGGFLVDFSTIDCGGGDSFQCEHSVGTIQRSFLDGDFWVEAESTHPDDLVLVRNTVVDGDIDVHFGTFQFDQSILRDGTLTVLDVAPTVTLQNSVFYGSTCALSSNVLPTAPVAWNVFWNTVSVCNGPDLVGTDGNVAVDPGFRDEQNDDFHLRPSSALIDGGVPDASWDDLDGTRSDIGIYGGKFTQDGGW